VGLHFQIRDDYQNLNSAEVFSASVISIVTPTLIRVQYSSQKGFCEDLDEGKYSFCLIHCLNSDSEHLQLREVLQRRREMGCLSKELKLLVLEQLKSSGSMEYTCRTLRRLQTQIEAEVRRLEVVTGRKNWVLRLLLQKLTI